MCLPVAGRVVELSTLQPGLAVVEIDGVLRDVNVSLLSAPPLGGDWLLVHLGFAVEAVSPHRAAEVMDIRREAGAGA